MYQESLIFAKVSRVVAKIDRDYTAEVANADKLDIYYLFGHKITTLAVSRVHKGDRVRVVEKRG